MKRAIWLILAVILLIGLALPIPVMAKTGWDLEGWRLDAGKWMDGLLFTYYEDDDVQYRLNATRFGGTGDLTVTVRHDYQDADGAYGVDAVHDFFVGEKTNRTTGPDAAPIPAAVGLYTVSAPRYVDVPNGVELHFDFYIPDVEAFAAAVGTDFSFYWKAHLAVTSSTPPPYGSSYWNGASLHAHTSVTGSQDVPIKTPPQEGPPPPPCIDVVKYVSVDGGLTWDDANSDPGPVFTKNPVLFKIVVTNCGETTLENIELTDTLYKNGSVLGTANIVPNKTTLAPLESDEIIVEYWASGCVYENVVRAVGVCAESGTPVEAVDSAWFYVP